MSENQIPDVFMFKVMGMDGKEYGPVSADQVRTWIGQGRLNRQSQIKVEGDAEWKTLNELPEFAPLVTAPQPASVPDVPGPEVPGRTSGLAIAALVCGLLGFLILPGLIGIVLAIIALVAIHKSQGRLRGTGMAIAGLCISGAFMLFLPIMAAMLLPALARAKTRAQDIQCMNHVKQINIALIMYANDNNDRFPPAEKWCDLLRPYTGGSTLMFQCPVEPGGRCAFSYNASLANQKLSDIHLPMRTVLVFSSANGWNLSGGPEMARAHKHGARTVTVGFADGHVERKQVEQMQSLQWEP